MLHLWRRPYRLFAPLAAVWLEGWGIAGWGKGMVIRMKALLKKELRLSRKILLVWMGFVLILCGFAYFEYLALQGSLGELAGMVEDFPKILRIMFGVNEELASALGWYGCIYFWAAFLAYGYAVYLGVSCVAKEGAQGTAEYLFTKPVGRSQIVAAKAAACVCNLLALTVFCGICNYFTAILPLGGLEQKGAVVATVIGMFLTEAVLFALALLLSSVAPTYKGAVRLGAGLLLGAYAIYIFAEYQEMPILYYLTPLKYFDVYMVARDGFRISFLLMAAVIILVSVLASGKSWSAREL